MNTSWAPIRHFIFCLKIHSSQLPTQVPCDFTRICPTSSPRLLTSFPQLEFSPRPILTHLPFYWICTSQGHRQGSKDPMPWNNYMQAYIVMYLSNNGSCIEAGNLLEMHNLMTFPRPIKSNSESVLISSPIISDDWKSEVHCPCTCLKLNRKVSLCLVSCCSTSIPSSTS